MPPMMSECPTLFAFFKHVNSETSLLSLAFKVMTMSAGWMPNALTKKFKAFFSFVAYFFLFIFIHVTGLP